MDTDQKNDGPEDYYEAPEYPGDTYGSRGTEISFGSSLFLEQRVNKRRRHR